MDNEIIMLGTGSAFPQHFYHSCFLLRSLHDTILVDGGGGMEVLRRIEEAGTPLRHLHHMFVSHVHTDHIFGAVWVIRRLIQFSLEGTYDGVFTVYANSEVTNAIMTICKLTLLPQYFERMQQMTKIVTVNDGQTLTIGPNMNLRFIDSKSNGCLQYGFIATLHGGTRVAFLGDESLTDRNRESVSGVDHLICGAYCSYADRDIFHPYEKHHHTVRDVAAMAAIAKVKNLILCHCEDRAPALRQEHYRAEASEMFNGTVKVPVDMEKICL